MRIGILALQGNYAQHKIVLDKLSISNELIIYPEQMSDLSGLIIPGGESSVMSKHIENNDFRNKIIEFSDDRPIFGTCAGMILLSSSKKTNNVDPLNIMDFSIDRNAWGRQIDSFSTKINIDSEIASSFEGYFIRSPKVKYTGVDINVLATYDKEPIMLTDGKHLVSSFHPEIGGDDSIHKFFINNLHG